MPKEKQNNFINVQGGAKVMQVWYTVAWNEI